MIRWRISSDFKTLSLACFVVKDKVISHPGSRSTAIQNIISVSIFSLLSGNCRITPHAPMQDDSKVKMYQYRRSGLRNTTGIHGEENPQGNGHPCQQIQMISDFRRRHGRPSSGWNQSLSGEESKSKNGSLNAISNPGISGHGQLNASSAHPDLLACCL